MRDLRADPDESAELWENSGLVQENTGMIIQQSNHRRTKSQPSQLN